MFLAHDVPNTVLLPAFPQVSSESYATPQASVASRRVARGRSLAPRAASVPPRPLYQQVESHALAATPTETSATTATYTQAFSSAPAPAPPAARARRPIIVYAPAPQAQPQARRAEDRARSVPPVVFFRREEKRQQQQRVAAVAPAPVRRGDDWRGRRARAWSVPPPPVAAPPAAAAAPPSPRGGSTRRRYRASSVHPLVAAPPQLPLPTAGLRAHKLPRRFLTRSGIRTGFTSLRGYHGAGGGDGGSGGWAGEDPAAAAAALRREEAERGNWGVRRRGATTRARVPSRSPHAPPPPLSTAGLRAHAGAPLATSGLHAHRAPRRFLTRSLVRDDLAASPSGYYLGVGSAGRRDVESEATAGIRRSIARARVLASPLARAAAARASGRWASPPFPRPKPKPAPIRESLMGFPKVYVPRKGPKPSNRSKVTTHFCLSRT